MDKIEWKLVPVEPTGEMVYALNSYISATESYKAALAAAPTPPAQAGIAQVLPLPEQPEATLTTTTPSAQEAEPVAFLLNGARFKMSFNSNHAVHCFANYHTELNGQWVALVDAENDKHMIHARPVNDKLRQAAAEVYDGVRHNSSVPIDLVLKLKDALEGKS